MALPKQIVRGLFHWTARHPQIHIRVSSYYLARERVLIDPLLPSPGGLQWLERHGPPEHILLTNRLHSRHSARLVAAFGCTVWCDRSGLYDLGPELKARPFAAGDALPGGARAFKIGVLCPDESARSSPASGPWRSPTEWFATATARSPSSPTSCSWTIRLAPSV